MPNFICEGKGVARVGVRIDSEGDAVVSINGRDVAWLESEDGQLVLADLDEGDAEALEALEIELVDVRNAKRLAICASEPIKQEVCDD